MNRFPLMLGATPLKVFIDGEKTYQHPFFTLQSALTSVPKANEATSTLCETRPNRHSYLLENLDLVIIDEKTSFGSNVVLYVEQGVVKCVGHSRDCQGIVPKDVERISTKGGVIVPVRIDSLLNNREWWLVIVNWDWMKSHLNK
jgi:hypothetical protein